MNYYKCCGRKYDSDTIGWYEWSEPWEICDHIEVRHFAEPQCPLCGEYPDEIREEEYNETVAL